MKRLPTLLLALLLLCGPALASSTPNKGYDLQTTGTNRGLWGVIVNNIFTKIDLNIAGRLEVDVSGSSDVTISSTQAEYLYHELSGTLTGNIDYIVPDKGAFFIIENITTGSYTLTVATSNGGTGVTVPQSGRSLVYVNMDDNKVVEVIPLGTTLNYVTTDRLLGRDTAGTGAVEELTVSGGIEFTSSGGIQRSALTGDVTASAGSGSTTIANDAVTTVKILDDAVTLAKIDGDAGFANKLIGYDGSGNPGNISFSSSITLSSSTLSLSVPVLHIQDQKASGTNGGTCTSGAWRTRDLNTEVTDTILSTLSSNQFTLPAGSYDIQARAPAFNTNNHKAKLYNITDAADVLIGTSEYSSNGAYAQTSSVIMGRFTIASQKTFEIQHRCSLTASTTGFGVPSSLSVVEIYTDVLIRKVD